MSMAGQFSDGFLQRGSVNDVSSKVMYGSSFLYEGHSSTWYFSRKELEINSPSRKDGIDWMKEEELRAQYSSLIQKLGMELKVPQLTISTAIMFCHRFYLHQSHSKNSWQTVATACLFLASKVEETPCLLDKVVNLAYKKIRGKSSSAAERIHLNEVIAKQKELVLTGERLLLATIGFDFNIQHPYKPLVLALKKLKLQNVLTKFAWNFVNDWLRSSLCLQYEPHYIAAGSLYLAAKLNNVVLPSQRGSAWWQEFDVAPRKLQEVIQHMIQQIGFKTANKPQGKETTLSLLVNRSRGAPFACEQGKTTDAQLSAKESSSPDSVLSQASLESTRPMIKHPSEGGPKLAELNGCNGSRTACSSENVESRCQHLENPHGMVDDGEGASGREGNVNAESGRTTGNDVVSTSLGLDLSDRERIRAKLKRRRWEKENKGVTVTDVSMEDSLVSEIESGIVVGAPDKKVAKLET